MKLLLIRASLLALLLGPSVFAQERHDLVSRVERIFAEKEPAWKVNSKSAGGASLSVIHLKSGRSDALVYIWVMDSERTAAEVFEGNTIAFGNTMGRRGRRSVLPDFGDENYMWTGFGVGGATSIDFRKGNVCVNIKAPSQRAARRFAHHVMGLVVGLSKTGAVLN